MFPPWLSSNSGIGSRTFIRFYLGRVLSHHGAGRPSCRCCLWATIASCRPRRPLHLDQARRGQISDEPATDPAPLSGGRGVATTSQQWEHYIIEDEDEENTAYLDQKRIHCAPLSPALQHSIVHILGLTATRRSRFHPRCLRKYDSSLIPVFFLLWHWASSASQWRDIGFLCNDYGNR